MTITLPGERAGNKVEWNSLLHDAPFLQRLLYLVVGTYLCRRQNDPPYGRSLHATIQRLQASGYRRSTRCDSLLRSVLPYRREGMPHIPVGVAVRIVSLHTDYILQVSRERATDMAVLTLDKVGRVCQCTSDGCCDTRCRDLERQPFACQRTLGRVVEPVTAIARSVKQHTRPDKVLTCP